MKTGDSERHAVPLSGEMAGPTRFELATSGVTGRRSNQLNYGPAFRINNLQPPSKHCQPFRWPRAYSTPFTSRNPRAAESGSGGAVSPTCRSRSIAALCFDKAGGA